MVGSVKNPGMLPQVTQLEEHGRAADAAAKNAEAEAALLTAVVAEAEKVLPSIRIYNRQAQFHYLDLFSAAANEAGGLPCNCPSRRHCTVWPAKWRGKQAWPKQF